MTWVPLLLLLPFRRKPHFKSVAKMLNISQVQYSIRPKIILSPISTGNQSLRWTMQCSFEGFQWQSRCEKVLPCKACIMDFRSTTDPKNILPTKLKLVSFENIPSNRIYNSKGSRRFDLCGRPRSNSVGFLDLKNLLAWSNHIFYRSFVTLIWLTSYS